VAEDLTGAHGQAPIIIKKVKKGGHGHHGGAWKVAYADMVTALMALFIVLWILGQSDEIVQNVAGYFRDPVGFRKGGEPSVFKGGTDAGSPTVLDIATPVHDTSVVADHDADNQWQERAKAIRSALARSDAFEAYEDQIELAMSPDGMRISLIESDNSPLFQPGGTRLNPDARDLLLTLSGELRRLRHFISIDGHTDNAPYTRGGLSNWELSSGRAQEARRVLERGGVSPRRIYEVRGLADRQPYNPLDPGDSRNRRVTITMLSEEAYDRRQAQVTSTVLMDEVVR
jgi:chemotaxis protein MotB